MSGDGTSACCSPVRTTLRVVGFKLPDSSSVSPTSVLNGNNSPQSASTQPSPLSLALERPAFPRLSINTGKKKSKAALLKKSKSYADFQRTSDTFTPVQFSRPVESSLPSTPFSSSRASACSEPMTIPYRMKRIQTCPTDLRDLDVNSNESSLQQRQQLSYGSPPCYTGSTLPTGSIDQLAARFTQALDNLDEEEY